MDERMTAGQVGQGNWWTEGIPSIQDQLLGGDSAEDIAHDIMIHAEAEHIEIENDEDEIVAWIESLRPLDKDDNEEDN